VPSRTESRDEAADKPGRGPVAIRRMYNIFGQFGSGSGLLEGTPVNWAEQLAALTLEHGMSTYILGTDDPDTVRRFAAEVAPAVRELVATERERDIPANRSESQGVPTMVERDTRANRSESHGVLTVQPTPDDGTRLTQEVPWDESGRPTHTEPAGRTYTEADNAAPQHLIDIHDGLRSELGQLRDILEQVRTGHASVGQARSVINTLTMRQNNWTLGGYRQAYCRILTGHHTLEDRSVFPHLRRSEPGLDAVIDQLETEHVEIHGLVDALVQALVGRVGTDGTGTLGEQALADVQRAVDVLTDALLSHLAYEERELIGPLARHAFY